MIKFLDLNKQYTSIKDEIDLSIRNVIEESAFIGGKYVSEFEQNFACYAGASYCVGVGNGTDALEIAIEALDLPKGSEVIVPANSFIATSEAVTRMGHKVVFANYSEDNYVLCVKDVKNKITHKTKAIIAVHLYGHPCDMDALRQIADEYSLFVIEDSAQAHGAEFKGQKIGSIGDIATFSFYPGKNLGAYGDGGAITTNSESLAIKSRMIANHGRLSKYNHEFEGRNSRLDGLQAAILSVKLNYLDKWTEQRIAIADYYLECLQGVGDIVLPFRSDWAKQVYHLFVIRTDRRDELQDYLKSKGVQTGVHYPILLPNLPAYSEHESNNQFKDFGDKYLSLPIGEHLTLDDAKHVVGEIRNFYASFSKC